MNKTFSEEETRVWSEGLPKKVIGVKVIIQSDQGNLLLVKPNYKNHWHLPGGVVDAKEEPKKALLRGINEELDLELDPSSLQIVDTLFKEKFDHLVIIYKYTIPVEENVKVTLQYEELDDYGFIQSEKLKNYLTDYYYNLLQAD